MIMGFDVAWLPFRTVGEYYESVLIQLNVKKEWKGPYFLNIATLIAITTKGEYGRNLNKINLKINTNSF